MTLALACVAVAGFMACQDVLATSMVVAESRNLGRWAGTLDALNDFASRYGGAITAFSVLRWGLWSWQTLLLVCLTAGTSFVATSGATTLAHRLLPVPRSS